jgi:uncharacterized UBP type Zn finger protein
MAGIADSLRDLSARLTGRGSGCRHLPAGPDPEPKTTGCEECLAAGMRWVHLRLCLTCGHVGCCNASEGKHATAHFEETGHPVIRSHEPGETWCWCYEDQLQL